jgi:predicted nucleotidyltransferase
MSDIQREIPDNLIKNIKKICQKEDDILAAFIFGSYGTKYQRDESDLDLAVLFYNSPTIMEQMELAGRLDIELDGIEIDLINLNNSKLILQHEVILKGEKIFTKDEIKTADFIEYVLKFAPDARIFYKKYQKEYISGLKEELK